MRIVVSINAFFLLFFFNIFFSSHVTAGDSKCLEERYVFDVGSGSTKSKAYLVDKCNNKIVKTIGEINKHIRYHDCIEDSPDKKTITKDCLVKGYNAVKEIERGYGIKCNKKKCAGVATAWSRDARNSNELLGIFRAGDINIVEISQSMEGELGFRTAINDREIKKYGKNKIIAWDIGGGSTQLSTLHNGKIHTYEGAYGIINFFYKVRERLKSKGYHVKQEGYFNKGELLEIFRYVKQELESDIIGDSVLMQKLHEKDVRVVGIGRVMYLGIKEELELNNPITKDNIKEMIYKFADISVQDARRKFPKLPEHFITLVQQALILVYSIMEAADINDIYTVGSTITDQLAIDETIWGQYIE